MAGAKFTTTAHASAAATDKIPALKSTTKGYHTPETIKVYGRTAATDNSAASAGAIGELKSSEIAVGSAVALTTGAISNITTLSLEAGNWLIWGAIKFTGNVATTVSSFVGSISSLNNSVTSGLAVQASTHRVSYNSFTVFNAVAAGSQIMPISPGLIRLSATTSYYLNARADFATNTCSAWGDLYAMRIY